MFAPEWTDCNIFQIFSCLWPQGQEAIVAMMYNHEPKVYFYSSVSHVGIILLWYQMSQAYSVHNSLNIQVSQTPSNIDNYAFLVYLMFFYSTGEIISHWAHRYFSEY